MNSAYTVKWKEQSSQIIECVPEEQVSCVDWSVRNTIAFASSCAPAQDQGPATRPRCTCIHVFEPDRPWERTTFDSQHASDVARLLWHPTGIRLLSVDTCCQCKVWEQENQHINVYKCHAASVVSLPSDSVMEVMWLQQRNQVVFQSSTGSPNNIGTRLWTDKFTKLPRRTPLGGILGKSLDGFVVITKSLKLHVVLLEVTPRVFTHILPGLEDSSPVTADLAITTDGQLVVGVGFEPYSVAVYYVLLVITYGGQCEISVTHQHSFSGLQLSPEQAHVQQSAKVIAHLVLASYPALSAVISVTDNNSCSHLELWENQGSVELPSWAKAASHRLKNGKVTSIKLLGLPAKKNVNSGVGSGLIDGMMLSRSGNRLSLNLHGEANRGMRSAVVVSLDSGHAVCLDRRSLSVVATSVPVGGKSVVSQTSSSLYGELIPAGKKLRLSVSQSLSSLAVSPNHCCVVGVTNIGNLSLFRFSLRTLGLPSDGHGLGFATLASHLSSLFAYSLVSGSDWWDILVCFCGIHMQGLFDVVVQQLDDAFAVQPASQRQVVFPSYLAMLLTLWRCLPQGREVAMLIHSQLVLFNIGTLFRSLLLRQTNVWLESQLNEINKTPMNDELERVMETVDLRNGGVDAGELLSCRHLIQLVADVAANLIQRDGMALAQAASYVKTETLCTLRELLVIIRQWIDIEPRCIPSFSGVPESMDCLSVLFKQVTKLTLHRKLVVMPDDNPNDVDPTIPFLPAPPNYEQVDPYILATGYTSGRYGHATQAPSYEFDCTPQSFSHPLEFKPHDPFLAAGLKTPKGIAPPRDCTTIVRDVIWQLHLGTDAFDSQMKQCTRCCGWSLPVTAPSSSACMIAWQCRWMDVCICGGQWKIRKGEKNKRSSLTQTR